jgi:hypothetical protein
VGKVVIKIPIEVVATLVIAVVGLVLAFITLVVKIVELGRK